MRLLLPLLVAGCAACPHQPAPPSIDDVDAVLTRIEAGAGLGASASAMVGQGACWALSVGGDAIPEGVVRPLTEACEHSRWACVGQASVGAIAASIRQGLATGAPPAVAVDLAACGPLPEGRGSSVAVDIIDAAADLVRAASRLDRDPCRASRAAVGARWAADVGLAIERATAGGMVSILVPAPDWPVCEGDAPDTDADTDADTDGGL